MISALFTRTTDTQRRNALTSGSNNHTDTANQHPNHIAKPNRQELNNNSPASTLLAQAQQFWQQLFASEQSSHDVRRQQYLSRPIDLTSDNMKSNVARGALSCQKSKR